MGKSYFAKTSTGDELIVQLLGRDMIQTDGETVQVNVIKDGLYELTNDSTTHRVLVVKRDPEFTRLMINGRLCDVSVESEGARLIKKLGLDAVRKKRVKDLKAPMPGMVLKVLVKEGDQVQKGDGLLVLEAMKMENMIKATDSALVGKVGVKEGQAVEKGQLLIKFS